MVSADVKHHVNCIYKLLKQRKAKEATVYSIRYRTTRRKIVGLIISVLSGSNTELVLHTAKEQTQKAETTQSKVVHFTDTSLKKKSKVFKYAK